MKRDKNKNPFVPPTESELIDRYISQLEEKEKQNRTVKYKPRYKRRRRFLPLFLTCLLVAAGLFALLYFDVISLPQSLFSSQPQSSHPTQVLTSSDLLPENNYDEEENPNNQNTGAVRPSKLFGVTITAKKDFNLATAKTDAQKIVDNNEKNGFTALFLNLNSDIGLFTDTPEGSTALTDISELAHAKAQSLFGVIDVKALADGDFTLPQSQAQIVNKIELLCKTNALDGIMLTGVERAGESTDFYDYVKTGSLGGFDTYRKDRLTAFVLKIGNTVRTANGAMLYGLICDDVYTLSGEKAIAVKSDTELLNTHNADVLKWMESSYFDIVFVTADTPTTSKDKPFETVVKWWHNNAPASCDVGFMLSSDLAVKGSGNWKNPDQLGRQLKILNEVNRYVFCFNDYSALISDKSGAADLVYKYLSGGIESDYIMRELSFTSPKKTDFTTYEKTVGIIGASDPNFELTLNGKAVERTKDGYFSLQLDLKVGKNTFKFSHKGSEKTFTVYYRYVVIKDYSPQNAVTLDGGDTIMVKATARTGSTVKATLDGQTITLKMSEEEEHSDFATFIGGIKVKSGYKKDTSLGKIKFTGTHNGVTDTFSGGKVTVKKDKPPPSSAPPTVSSTTSSGSGGYIGVGNNLIAEATKYQIETFDGDKIDDLSQPYNNYLPKGTVDYCDEGVIKDEGSGNTYRLLRYGKRVYGKNIKTYRGSLPSSNKLSLKSFNTEGRYTVLTLKTDWKAPFKFELLPQKYQSKTGSNRGNISAATFTYIDITFCYASQFDVSLKDIANSPIFSKAQVIKNTADYTLRLYLKKASAFYGWIADYDASGNLVFKFLNPAKATVANNAYGGRLDGITVVVDAGHGGSDGGAVGSVAALDEANRNLLLAQKIKTKLESIGATVVMTRTADVSLTPDERILKLKNASPNLGISVHRDSAYSTSARGFGAYYFNPYTKAAADKIKAATAAKGTYTSTKTAWHVFYMSRITNCPVVLTENGFMSNSADFENMKSDAWNDKCADAIVKGTVDYFLSIG